MCITLARRSHLFLYVLTCFGQFLLVFTCLGQFLHVLALFEQKSGRPVFGVFFKHMIGSRDLMSQVKNR